MKVIGGIHKLFDGEHSYLIQQNSDIVKWSYPTTIGKILFWSYIHQGSWPKWLDPLHLQYIFYGKESIDTIDALHEHIPFFFCLSMDLRDHTREDRKEDLDYWIDTNGLKVFLNFVN